MYNTKNHKISLFIWVKFIVLFIIILLLYYPLSFTYYFYSYQSLATIMVILTLFTVILNWLTKEHLQSWIILSHRMGWASYFDFSFQLEYLIWLFTYQVTFIFSIGCVLLLPGSFLLLIRYSIRLYTTSSN